MASRKRCIFPEIRMRKSWGWEGKMDTFLRKETDAKHPEVRGHMLQGMWETVSNSGRV